MCTGASEGRPLDEAVQGCKRALGLKDSELQMTAPARVGFCAPSCVHAYSRVRARSYLLKCMHISPWLYSFTCTLSICFSVLPAATVISLSLSPFVPWAALLPLTSPCPSLFLLIIITLEPTYKAPRSLLCADTSGKTLQSLCAGERRFS